MLAQTSSMTALIPPALTVHPASMYPEPTALPVVRIAAQPKFLGKLARRFAAARRPHVAVQLGAENLGAENLGAENVGAENLGAENLGADRRS